MIPDPSTKDSRVTAPSVQWSRTPAPRTEEKALHLSSGPGPQHTFLLCECWEEERVPYRSWLLVPCCLLAWSGIWFRNGQAPCCVLPSSSLPSEPPRFQVSHLHYQLQEMTSGSQGLLPRRPSEQKLASQDAEQVATACPK